MNKLLILFLVFLSLLGCSPIKTVQIPKELKECYSSKTYLRASQWISAKDSRPDNAEEILLMQAMNKLTEMIAGEMLVIEGEEERESFSENATTTGNYSYNKSLSFEFITEVMYEETNNNHKNTFSSVLKLIHNEDTIRYSANSIRLNNKESFTENIVISANQDWYKNVIEELKRNGVNFNFINNKKNIGLCVSIKKDLIKKE